MKSIFNRKPFYWICVITTCCLCYGFTLTNPSVGVDDEAFSQYFDNGGMITQSRFGESLVRPLFDNHMFLPFWRDFIALIIIVLGITIWACLLNKASDGAFDEKVMTIFSCVAISFPFVASLFIFMSATTSIGYTIMLSAIAMHFFIEHAIYKKKIYNLIFSSLVLAFGISFFETALIYFLQGAFFIALLVVLYNRNGSLFTVKPLVKLFVKLLIVVLFSMLTWKVVAIALQTIKNIPASSYTRGYFQYNFLNLVADIPRFIKQFLLMIADMCYNQNITWIFLVCAVVAFTIWFVVLAIFRKNCLIALTGIGSIFAAFSLYIVTGNANLPQRATITLCLFMGFVIAILFKEVSTLSIKHWRLGGICGVAVCILVLNQSREANKIFFVDYLRYQQDLSKLELVVHDMEWECGAPLSKPVVFVGVPEPYNLPKGEVEGHSIFFWDRSAALAYELDSGRIFNFANMHGYKLMRHALSDVQIEELSQQIPKLAIWPTKGSIVDNGEYIVVKIGKSHVE